MHHAPLLPMTGTEEWRRYWPLPFVAMVGVAGQSLFSFSSGVFLGAMTEEFGWTRAEFTSGFTIQMLVYLIASPFVGRLIDRYGPRRTALLGIVPYILIFSCLGFANGDIWQWRFFCALQGLGVSCVSTAIWVSAIVGRFHAARGGALAIGLAGVGVSTALAPLGAAFFIEAIGWRLSFPALIGVWALVIIPLTWAFFRDPSKHGAIARSAGSQPNLHKPLLAVLRSRAFLCLAVAGGLYSSVSVGLTVHMVPLLQFKGFGLAEAAGLASAGGVATLAGRLCTGFLLDKFDAKQVGLCAFLLPILSVALLLNAGTAGLMHLFAVMLFGFAAGAETDVVTYMISKILPNSVFGSVYSIIMAIFAVCASMGPLMSSYIFDITAGYNYYLYTVIPIILVGSLFLYFVPKNN